MAKSLQRNKQQATPSDVQAMLSNRAGEFMFGDVLEGSEYPRWFSVRLAAGFEKALREAVGEIVEKAYKRLLCAQRGDGLHGVAKIPTDVKLATVRTLWEYRDVLIETARFPPRVRDWAGETDSRMREMEAAVRKKSRELSNGMRADFKRSSEFSDSVKRVCQEHNYAEPPPGVVAPTVDGDGLPRSPGIYFVWNANRIVYVGQSIRISNRATLSHDNIFAQDMLSWVECDEDELDFVEAFYIGVVRPWRNFGRCARHRKRRAVEAYCVPDRPEEEPRLSDRPDADGGEG